MTVPPVQVYRVYIKATPERIWAAITSPEWSQRYGYGGFVSYDLRPGGAYEVRPSAEFRAASLAMGNDLPEVVIAGEVLECRPAQAPGDDVPDVDGRGVLSRAGQPDHPRDQANRRRHLLPDADPRARGRAAPVARS